MTNKNLMKQLFFNDIYLALMAQHVHLSISSSLNLMLFEEG